MKEKIKNNDLNNISGGGGAHAAILGDPNNPISSKDSGNPFGGKVDNKPEGPSTNIQKQKKIGTV